MNETNLLKNQLLIYIKFILKPELSSCFFNVYMLEIDPPYFLKKSFECWKNVTLQHIFIFFWFPDNSMKISLMIFLTANTTYSGVFRTLWKICHVAFLQKLLAALDVKYHYVKSVRIRSYSGPYFPAFGDTLYLPVFSLNAGKYGPE